MAKGEEPEIFLRLRNAGRVKVRYGRANLTIQKTGAIRFLPTIAETLKARQRGEIDDQEVAWIFIKSRVTAHTPSFDWNRADLNKLLPLVTGVALEPEIKAKTPEELVPELEEITKQEQASWDKSTRRLHEQITKYRELEWSLAHDPSSHVGISLHSQQASLLKTFHPDLTALGKTAIALSKLNEPVVPSTFPTLPRLSTGSPQAMSLAALGLAPDPSTLALITSMAQEPLATAALGLHSKGFQGALVSKDWGKAAEEFSLATAADYPEAAEAVKATVEAAQDPEASDLELVLARMDQLEAAIQASNANSGTRLIVYGLASQIIYLIIQMILGRVGVHLPPP